MNKLLLTAFGFSTPKIINVAQKMIQENKITNSLITT